MVMKHIKPIQVWYKDTYNSIQTPSKIKFLFLPQNVFPPVTITTFTTTTTPTKMQLRTLARTLLVSFLFFTSFFFPTIFKILCSLFLLYFFFFYFHFFFSFGFFHYPFLIFLLKRIMWFTGPSMILVCSC